MTRLIDADDVMSITLERHCKDCIKRKAKRNGRLRVVYKIGEAPCRGCEIDDMKSMIEDAPTVDAEPVKHSKWIDIDSQMYTWKVRCDKCGHERSMMSTQGRYPKYCENCGAKMEDEERTGENK